MDGTEIERLELNLVGGALCLDFTNTVGDRARTASNDHLQSYDDLLAWSRLAGAVSAPEAELLREAAGQQPAEAARVFHRARTLREALYRIFAAAANDRAAAERDLDLLNRTLAAALPGLRVRP